MTTADLQQELTAIEAQRADAQRVVERCEGAAQMVRHLLGKLMRAEDEAKAAAAEAPAGGPTNDILPFPPAEPAAAG